MADSGWIAGGGQRAVDRVQRGGGRIAGGGQSAAGGGWIAGGGQRAAGGGRSAVPVSATRGRLGSRTLPN